MSLLARGRKVAMELKLEDISGQNDNVVITLWHVERGKMVSKGQDLLEISTDKATFDVSSPCDGVIDRIYKRPGDSVARDEAVAVIKETVQGGPAGSDV
ncbi:MAG: hypothetical protein GF392_04060 [Candidatus Omnitrophica bacterium]|nr:hypothetical protein [Candidatus Omnitrophota bacterium]